MENLDDHASFHEQIEPVSADLLITVINEGVFLDFRGQTLFPRNSTTSARR